MKRKTDLDFFVDDLLDALSANFEYAGLENPENVLAKILADLLPKYFNMPDGWNT